MSMCSAQRDISTSYLAQDGQWHCLLKLDPMIHSITQYFLLSFMLEVITM